MAPPASAWAQATNAPAGGGSLGSSPAAPGAATPLARYFPRENLIFYFEFSGVDSHAEAWNKTAAYKMLTETPLGEMLEEVVAQLLDKAFSYAPGRRFNGREVVTLLEYGLHHGIAFGVNARPTSSDKPMDFLAFTMVVRDGSSKEIRALTSRLMGLSMSNRKGRLEKREGRTVVVLPVVNSTAAKEVKYEGDAWWAEKDDLVVCSPYPSAVDKVFGALDGKIPSAVDHPIVQELSRKDGTFEPASIAFLDAEGCPKGGKLGEPFQKMIDVAGIQRIGSRWGFDDDALMQEIRIAAPRPRKPYLAVLDQPGFDAKSLMPLPQSVESFVQLSIDPNALLDSIAQIGPEGVVRARIDEFADSIRSSGKIDFRKDFLGRIGPRMVLFLAPDKSAAVGAGSFETNWLQGLSPQAGIPTSLLTHTKLTVLAEVSEPKAFARALEGAINALNHQFQAQTAELIEKSDPENGDAGTAGGAGAPGTRGGGRPGAARSGGAGGGQRGTRKRSTSSMSPRFDAMVDTSAAVAVGSSSASEKLAYILRTPSDSPLKIGPPNFHPVIKLDGKYLVVSVASDSADAALKAAKQKGWQPSDDLRKAGEHLPPKMILLGVSDPREIMPALLASLPGTLQTIINTSITVARARAGNPQPGGGNPPGPGAMPGGPGMASRPGAGGGMAPGVPPRGRRGGGGGPMPEREGSGGAPEPGAGGNNGPDIPADAMVELKVDSDKLPKADDLRSRYFLSTVAITVNDQDIRLVTRQAFMTHYDMIAVGGFMAGVLPAVQAARAAARRAQAANEQAAGGPAAGAAAGASGGMTPGRPPGPGGPGMPGVPPRGRGGAGGRGPGARGSG
jgi:hypothetical protein